MAPILVVVLIPTLTPPLARRSSLTHPNQAFELLKDYGAALEQLRIAKAKAEATARRGTEAEAEGGGAASGGAAAGGAAAGEAALKGS